MKHEWIRDRLRNLKPKGKSQAGLAGALDWYPPRVSDLIAGRIKNDPSAYEMITLARYLEMGQDEVIKLFARIPGAADPLKTLPDMGAPVELASIEAPQVGSLPKDLPVMGLVAGGPGDADFQLNGSISEFIRRPPALSHVRGAFAVRVAGTSMFPRFDEGEPVFINPAHPPKIGDYVLCELHATQAGEAGPAYVKLLKKRGTDHIELEQFNPPKTFTLDRKLIKSMFKVMLPADLFD